MKVPLSAIIKKLESGVSVNSEDRPASIGEVGVLKVSSVTGGNFRPAENKVVTSADERTRLTASVQSGDILMTRANGSRDLVGCSVLVIDNFDNLFLSDKLWRIQLREPSRDSSSWLYQLLNTGSVRQQVIDTASGSSGMRNISKAAFLSILVCRPPLEEQLALSAILETWDRGIRQLSDLIAAKVRFKQGLMQQLLTGKRRFPEFSERWQPKQIGSFLTESRIPGTHGAKAKKLTVKLYGKGVVAKSEARVGSEATRYYRRKAGQFIYSKLDFLNGAFGLVPIHLDGYESTLDLPAFDFDDSVDPDWFISYVVREEFYSNQLGLANGGRKARRVNPDDLLNLSIICPSKTEQTKIADVMKSMTREIDLLRKELETIKTQKKGLMQKLLTGQIRVPMKEEAASNE